MNEATKLDKKIGRPMQFKNLKMFAFQAEFEDINKFKAICSEGLHAHNVVMRELMKAYIKAYEDQQNSFEFNPSLGRLVFD